MSDLSVPPLSLVPIGDDPLPRLGMLPLAARLDPTQAGPPDAAGAPLAATSRPAPFAWPTPELPDYPAPVCLAAPEPCEVEGLNGHIMSGQLVGFDPALGVLQLKVPPSRSAIVLRFSQFRRLRLLAVLEPMEHTQVLRTRPNGGPGDATDESLHDELATPAPPTLPYQITLRSGPPLRGLTLAPVKTPFGTFLFEPADGRGAVRRSFVPAAACAALDLGDPHEAPAPAPTPAARDAVAPPAPIAATLVEAVPPRPSPTRAELTLVQQIMNPADLLVAIVEQARMPLVRIGEALVAQGLVSQQQVDDALAAQSTQRGVPLGELLVRRGDVTRQDLQTALVRKMGYPLVDVAHFPVDLDAVARLPYAVAHRLEALPLLLNAGRLVVAMVDPTRGDLIDEIEFAAQCKLTPVLARSSLLRDAVDRAYEMMGAEVSRSRVPGDPGAGLDFDADNASSLLATLEQQQQSSASRGELDEEAAIEQSDNSLVRLINTMILEAQAQGASDIHVECQPGRDKVRVRFRRDGQLRPYLELPHTYRSALIARLKIMCELDISERRKPQDGKINFGKFVQGQKLELRVATIPTHGGLEDAVLRLMTSARPIPLDKLGLSPANLRRFKELVSRPYGMLLCVGPTGSGKTTTLHSAMGHINLPHLKLWTAEDPIEITQPGLRQVQVNPKIDWTFAKALRSFLRADPDVIMVGEIRDRETAQVAIEASLTGHLVMSTLHTNSAPETVTRLLDMGMDPFNFADALLGVLAQRLVRRLCTDCRSSHEAGGEEIEELLRDHLHVVRDVQPPADADAVLAGWLQRFGSDGRLTLYRSVGCERCDGTGYRGRAAIHELMVVDAGLRQLVQTGARPDEIQRHALGLGMHTLRQDGIEKVLAGITTIEEVRANSNS
jgi:type II secretory ATPase GspE/PulE/Tfp pilus assembly ATPase PilB-like protein